MKKILLVLFSFILLSASFTYSAQIEVYKDKWDTNLQTGKQTNKYVSRKEIFIELFSHLEVLKSYHYIDLYYKDVKQGTALYDALQKAVYLDLFKNDTIKISPNKKMSQYYFLILIEHILNKNYSSNAELEKLKNKYVTKDLLEKVVEKIKQKDTNYSKNNKDLDMLLDIYSTILKEYYYRENVDKKKLLYKAIAGMLTELDDKFTRFFPPKLSKKFLTHINSIYEWIGIYTNIDDEGNLLVEDVIPNSPADKKGLKKGDIIRKIDWKEIDWLSQKDINSLIKGGVASKVKLEILRGIDVFTVEITREKILIPTVQWKILRWNVYYIDVNSFGKNTYNEFADQLEKLRQRKNIKKIIFDFRDNPGGYLDQAVKMLDIMIPKGKNILEIKYKNGEIKIKSKWTWLLDIDKYEVYILVNERSASASEVMVGVMKDYYPNIKVFGNTTYGKWSVQSFKIYNDGSSFKFTVAKWFIGKTKIGIDKIGIKPDVEVNLNEKLLNNNIDTQLNAILNL